MSQIRISLTMSTVFFFQWHKAIISGIEVKLGWSEDIYDRDALRLDARF